MKKLFVLLLWVIPAVAWAEKSMPIYGQLANGFRYALLPLYEEQGRIEVRLRVNAGAVDENDDQAGVAHMVEHLVFRSTEKYPQGVMPHLHENGWVRGRNYNALTNYDSTTYLFTPPKNGGLEQALEAMSQMLFSAKLTQSDLDDERNIIREEWRGGQGVAGRMNRQRTNAVREGSRYARFPVIGTQESIETMPVEQLQQFYQRWYVPNNMQLVVVGDIKPNKAHQLIKHYFGQVKRQKLPQRDYLEPPLKQGLSVKQLQDPQSGVSQVAYVYRFDESQHRLNTEKARYERLVDRLALMVITQRLRNQAEHLPENVRSVVVRKSDLGRNTVGLGFFSSVSPTSQKEGLAQIFTEIERLKRYPITLKELNAQKEKIQLQVENAKKHTGDRDFSGWVQVMVETFLLDKSYLSQPEIAQKTERMLAKISLTEINRRIRDWLSYSDQVLTYQAPKHTVIEPITVDFAKKLQKQIAFQQILPPSQEKMIEPMALDQLNTTGKIISETRFDSQNVVYWQLENGDKVVWLKSPMAKDRSYFRALNNAGFMNTVLGTWQSQIATQMIAQNAPLDWEVEQLNSWKQKEKVNLSINQSANQLQFEGSVENDKFASLLRLFYAYQLETRIKDGLDELKEEMAKNIPLSHENEKRHQAISQLRYENAITNPMPTLKELETLSIEELEKQWKKMISAPMTYYLVTDLAEKEVKALIANYLAVIPRKAHLESRAMLFKSGRETLRLAENLEPRDDVKMWITSPHQWQGKDAVMVSLLRHIASNKLKLALRDEQLGVYSLRFDSRLNPENGIIESELSFVANPALTEHLIIQAEQVLADLANRITEQDMTMAKSAFVRQEKERLNSPQTWLHRLMLSDQQYGSPRYLSEMQHLADEIDLAAAKQMAIKLYHSNDVKTLIITQQQ